MSVADEEMEFDYDSEAECEEFDNPDEYLEYWAREIAEE